MDSPRKANKFMMCFLIYSVLVSIAAVPIAFLIMFPLMNAGVEEGDMLQWVLIAQDFIIFMIPMAVYLIFSGQSLRDVLPLKRLSFKNAVYIVIITLLIMPMMTVLASSTDLLVQSDTSEMFTEIMENVPGWVSIVSMAILPPVFEESVFRGYILTGYKRYGFIKAAFVSALFFGMMHLDLYQLPYAAMVGVLFAGFVYYTGSIYSSMLAHFVVNGLQTFLFLLVSKFADMTELESETALTMEEQAAGIYVWLGIMIFCLPFLLYFVNRFVKRNRANYEEYVAEEIETDFEDEAAITENSSKSGKWFDRYFVITVLVYVVYMVLFKE